MDWFAPIDIYCERTAPGFWDEPFNALTNAAFLIAAAAAYARAGAEARRDPAVIGLTLTVVATGIGSFLFHTYAQVWSMLADTGAITVFVCWYLGFALRRFLAVSWPQMLLAVAAMLAAGLAADLLVPRGTLNGSVGYLPPLAALAAVGAVLARRGHPAAAHLAVAACVFAVSLALRTVDNAVCKRDL